MHNLMKGLRARRAQIGRWISNLLWLVLLVWAAPRCWPHVEAIVGVRARDTRQPAFTVQTRDGRVLTADSLRGRVVLVNIWATWCPPCRAEMPALQQLASSHADEPFVLLGLSVDRGPASSVDAFLRERGITYPNAIIDDDVLRAFGGVRGYPTSFLLDKQGVLRHTVLGPVAPLTLRPAISRLLQEDAAPTRADSSPRPR